MDAATSQVIPDVHRKQTEDGCLAVEKTVEAVESIKNAAKDAKKKAGVLWSKLKNTTQTSQTYKEIV